MKKLSFMVLALGLMACITPVSGAQMGSDSYQITTSVLSAGGYSMSSDNYEIFSTLGQPSPVMDPADPPFSDSHDLYPGFHYTMEAGEAGHVDIATFSLSYGSVSTDDNYSFLCDFDRDGDVDGSDLLNL